MQRRTQTLPKIKKAFIKLIHEKGMDNLTVSDVAREAGINRGTFYLHYIDKYDLMEKLESRAIIDLETILNDNINSENVEDPLELIPYAAIYKALLYVKEEFALVEALASDGGDPSFFDRVKGILEQFVAQKLDLSMTLVINHHAFPVDYAKELLLSGTVTIIERWIHKGGEEDPEIVARMIEEAKHLSPVALIATTKQNAEAQEDVSA
ncbi:MAG: TetR/AcrR family transcriptional regulator [Aerococcus sp.]|nr:TetR/AcrR family transcriptional regulator [Aerococcus sp.]